MTECDGKRAGDTCTSADGGVATCVPDCDAQCLVCVTAVPAKPDQPVTAGGGCSAGGGLVLVLALAFVLCR